MSEKIEKLVCGYCDKKHNPESRTMKDHTRWLNNNGKPVKEQDCENGETVKV